MANVLLLQQIYFVQIFLQLNHVSENFYSSLDPY